MKKISETLAKVFAGVAIVPVLTLSIIACTGTGKKKADPNLPNASLSSQTGNLSQDNTDVNDGENEVLLNGIYAFSRDIDIYKDSIFDEETVKNNFKTRDMNGVYLEAQNHGLDTFLKNITSKNGKQLYIQFETTETAHKFYFVTNENGTFTRIDNKDHFYTVTGEGYETSDDEPIIMFDSTKNEVTLIYEFTYTESGRVVKSELFYKTTLSFVQSENV